jgi:hypothetical protein
MCATKQGENRYTDNDQPYAGNNSGGGAARFPDTNGNVTGKMATLSELADANFRLQIPLHFSLTLQHLADYSKDTRICP